MLEPDVIRGYERKLDSMLEAAATDDPETFAIIVGLLDRARLRGLPAAAQRLNADYSYTEIARACGVHRSAALQRFGPKAAARGLADLSNQTDERSNKA